MPSGSKWSETRVPDCGKFVVAQCDVKNYFYNLALPEGLSDFFALPPVRVSELRSFVPADACPFSEGKG
eukprot:8729352-Alexandrium_andersonii.AAC.1